MKKLYAVVATEAQKYIASMFEVHSDIGQLKVNLREQHRIWLDFYSTVFHVSMLGCSCVDFCLIQHATCLSSVSAAAASLP